MIKDHLQEKILLKRRENDSRRSFLLHLKNTFDQTQYSQYSLFKKQISDQKKIHLIGNIQRVDSFGEMIRDDFNLETIIQAYHQTAVSALCVLAESHFFQGKISDVKRAVDSLHIPVLMKDLLIDELQLYEALYAGASAMWVTVGVLSDMEIKQFLTVAQKLDLDLVFEITTLEEYHRVASLGGQIIALEKNIISLMDEIQASLFYDSSLLSLVYGDIQSTQEIQSLKQKGFTAVLVTELFLKTRDIVFQVNEFLGSCLFFD